MISALNTLGDASEALLKHTCSTFAPATVGWLGGRYIGCAGHGLLIGVLTSVYNSVVTVPVRNFIDHHNSKITDPSKRLQNNAASMLSHMNYMASFCIPLVVVHKYGSLILSRVDALTYEKASKLLCSQQPYTHMKGVKTMIAPILVYWALDMSLPSMLSRRE